MKNYLILVFFSFSFFAQSQSNCVGKGAEKVYHVNNIGASFSPQGAKFLPLNKHLRAPYTSVDAPATICDSNPWIAGYVNGELRVAAQRFADGANKDFYTGPLLEGAETMGSDCFRYNNIWTVTRADLLRHREDFESDGVIDDTVTSVFGWPAQGNDFFQQFNGFVLPDVHHGGWAAFSDLNNNGKYEPDLGDYPCVFINEVQYDPEEIMWMVFNDQGPHEGSNGVPLGVEIQLTVFAFNCVENSVLNNALFNTYKVINQNFAPIDSLYFGMWAAYVLGCSDDDYMGCDTIRNTEYVYNQDPIDGDGDGSCATSESTYGIYPPVQSMTYLSHRMSSYVLTILSPIALNPDLSPEQTMSLLQGIWMDGTPISIFEDGYNPGESYPVTKYLYHGDPRDQNQWSQTSFEATFSSPLTISAVHLDHLDAFDSAIIETVYMFHQDSSLDNISQIGFMNYQIDSLFTYLNSAEPSCIRPAYCEDGDSTCVWPGDFNHNGIADHYDLLYWGVMKDNVGAGRNGRMNWEGYVGMEWPLDLPDGINAKHGDGNGNGIVAMDDMDRNIQHFLFTNQFYIPQNLYPEGPEMGIKSSPMDTNGAIDNIIIFSGIDIENVLGLAYEFEYDTSIYEIAVKTSYNCPEEKDGICLFDRDYNPSGINPDTSTRYAFVRTDHNEMVIEKGFWFNYYAWGLILKEGVSYADIPDTVILRLKNLIAVDAEGNDLHIGCIPLKVPKHVTVGYHDPAFVPVTVYPSPSQGILYIDTDQVTDAQLFSIDGLLIRHIKSSELHSPVDVSGLPPGLYILRIMATGETVKVVLQ